MPLLPVKINAIFCTYKVIVHIFSNNAHTSRGISRHLSTNSNLPRTGQALWRQFGSKVGPTSVKSQTRLKPIWKSVKPFWRWSWLPYSSKDWWNIAWRIRPWPEAPHMLEANLGKDWVQERSICASPGKAADRCGHGSQIGRASCRERV